MRRVNTTANHCCRVIPPHCGAPGIGVLVATVSYRAVVSRVAGPLDRLDRAVDERLATLRGRGEAPFERDERAD